MQSMPTPERESHGIQCSTATPSKQASIRISEDRTIQDNGMKDSISPMSVAPCTFGGHRPHAECKRLLRSSLITRSRRKECGMNGNTTPSHVPAKHHPPLHKARKNQTQSSTVDSVPHSSQLPRHHSVISTNTQAYVLSGCSACKLQSLSYGRAPPVKTPLPSRKWWFN